MSVCNPRSCPDAAEGDKVRCASCQGLQCLDCVSLNVVVARDRDSFVCNNCLSKAIASLQRQGAEPDYTRRLELALLLSSVDTGFSRAGAPCVRCAAPLAGIDAGWCRKCLCEILTTGTEQPSAQVRCVVNVLQ